MGTKPPATSQPRNRFVTSVHAIGQDIRPKTLEFEFEFAFSPS